MLSFDTYLGIGEGAWIIVMTTGELVFQPHLVQLLGNGLWEARALRVAQTLSTQLGLCCVYYVPGLFLSVFLL